MIIFLLSNFNFSQTQCLKRKEAVNLGRCIIFIWAQIMKLVTCKTDKQAFSCNRNLFFLSFFFLFIIFFYLWWILSYIEMKQPWVYMCSHPNPPSHLPCNRNLIWMPISLVLDTAEYLLDKVSLGKSIFFFLIYSSKL